MPNVWAIDGVPVPASVARLVAYVAGSGNEGVVEPGGLKVTPQAAPTGSVLVRPGAGLVMNRYAGGTQQAYAVQETTGQTVSIAPTGSSGPRSDLIVARVRDNQYAQGTQGATFEVIQGVGATDGVDYVRALPYPALALARVTLPASTAAVAAQHITDLRVLANPRTERHLLSAQPPVVVLGRAASGYTAWPGFQPELRVPTWATWVTLKCDLSGVGMTGNVDGVLRAKFGSVTGGDLIVDTDVSGASRVPYTITASGWLQDVDRGQLKFPVLEGRLYPSSPQTMGTNAGSHMIWDIQFEQRAV